jgi:hypothetical protein
MIFRSVNGDYTCIIAARQLNDHRTGNLFAAATPAQIAVKYVLPVCLRDWHDVIFYLDEIKVVVYTLFVCELH